ncbi:MAG TPA: SurA N-terminal domain-containing protein [Candidatus Saccharimonadales bacterium]|nr:SurA N-terminal domain-containing protein [Candidatus Saccharimonadales bacterium]
MATKSTTAKRTTTKKPTTKAATRKAPSRSASRSTTSKSKAATSTPKIEEKSSSAAVSSTPATSTSAPASVRIKKQYLLLIIIIILLGAALYYFRGLFVAAVVNGQPISRLQVIQQAEKQSGKQTLDTLVRDALIEQQAKKENVTVSDQEVNTQIATLQSNLQKQGQNLNEVLATQGMTPDDLKNLIRLDQLVQKMVGKNIKVSDKEVNDYIAQNKSSLPNADDATLKKEAKAQLTQQKTNAAVQTWLANLQKNSNIIYFVQY